MATPMVRADYEQLKDTAGRFGSQAEAARETLHTLQNGLVVLRAGDWQGQGASAFYQEMDGSVLPAFQRLIAALDNAASGTLQMGAIMQAAEDQAARVLQGAAAASGGPPGDGAATGGAVGGGRLGGGADPRGIGAGLSAPAPAPNLTPPDTSRSFFGQVLTGGEGLGLGSTVMSILEGGSVAEAAVKGVAGAAGTGTTVAAFLLPLVGWMLGTEIAEEAERREQLIENFKTELKASAITDATQRAVEQAEWNRGPVRPLNAAGQAAANEATEFYRAKMEDEINAQLTVDAAIHGHPEKAWQAHYDEWVEGLSQHLDGIYTNPKLTQ